MVDTKTNIYRYFYQQCLVLFTIPPRNSGADDTLAREVRTRIPPFLLLLGRGGETPPELYEVYVSPVFGCHLPPPLAPRPPLFYQSFGPFWLFVFQ